MATDFNKQAARLVAAIPTDSQGDGRKFADAVRKSLNYIATYAGTGNGSGGGGGGGDTTVTTISNQLSNVKMTYERSGDYYNLIVTWETGNFNDARVYKYALLNLQQAPQKGDTSVNWNQVGARIYQSKDGAKTATIPNVLPGYRYRVVAIGVTDDGKRSEENKAPDAVTFIPVQIRDTTPPASLSHDSLPTLGFSVVLLLTVNTILLASTSPVVLIVPLLIIRFAAITPSAPSVGDIFM